MNFEEFLQKVAPKVGPNGAFSLARDARITALEKILSSKLNIQKEEIDKSVDEELEKLATNILKMPPLPN
ncbi:MAG: hypothetical protein AAB364_01505 [Patescibacteria group bacterium]